MTDTVTVDMALEQAERATDMAAQLAEALDEARVLLIRVLGVTPGELEPPILKEQGDLANAREMSRKVLEEKYALSRMTARLSMKKAEDLESERDELAGRLEFLNMQNSAQQEQLDELEIQTAQLSARLAESDVEHDRLTAHVSSAESEKKPAQNEAISRESEQKGAHSDQGAA